MWLDKRVNTLFSQERGEEDCCYSLHPNVVDSGSTHMLQRYSSGVIPGTAC
jgi:hypothetical protein